MNHKYNNPYTQYSSNYINSSKSSKEIVGKTKDKGERQRRKAKARVKSASSLPKALRALDNNYMYAPVIFLKRVQFSINRD